MTFLSSPAARAEPCASNALTHKRTFFLESAISTHKKDEVCFNHPLRRDCFPVSNC